MVAVVRARKLSAMIETAASAGATHAWISDMGTISIGNGFADPRWMIDLAGETLSEVPAPLPSKAGFAQTASADKDFPAREALADDLSGTGRRTGFYSVTIDGRRINAPSARSFLGAALLEMESLRPGTLSKLSSEKGRTKRVVARRREDLYDNPKLLHMAVPLGNGWWLATNNSRTEVARFLRRAAWLAGLEIALQGLD